MPGVDSSIVLLPRFTSLAGETSFTTIPMDVSTYGGAQFQVWRGPIRVKTELPVPTFSVQMEESLDAEHWALGPAVPATVPVLSLEHKFFSYSFRLRWFRLRVILTGIEPIVSCWAEGLLRGGGSGVWGPRGTPYGEVGANSRLLVPPTGPLGDPHWEQRQRDAMLNAAIARVSSVPGTYVTLDPLTGALIQHG